MKKMKTLLTALFLFCLTNSYSQIYSEDFDGALTWTINTVIATEDGFPNVWYISCQEEGVGTGLCGASCGVGDNTLHVSWNAGLGGDLGAGYFEAGGFTSSHRRAESANISTIGASAMTLSFDMIGWGGNANDFTEVVYSIDGGATWTTLDGPLTSQCCGGVVCDGVTQGLWQTNSYPLPALAEGEPDFRIGFIWNNIDDGVATDPSFAVDNISITGTVGSQPVAMFEPSVDTTICEGSTLTFTDMSTTTDVISSWVWSFPGGTPSSATGVGPHDIVYSTPGTYAALLDVTDGIGTDDFTIDVEVEALPDAGLDGTYNFCSSDGSADLFLELTGPDAGGVWEPTLTSGTGFFDPANDSPGTIEYIVSGTACPNDTSEVIVTITTAANAGTSGTASFCSSDATVDLTTLLGAPDAGGTWSPLLDSGGDVFDPSTDAAITYTYTVAGTSPCLSAAADVIVSIETMPNAGMNGTHDFCSSDVAADLFLNLTGSDAGGVWEPTLASGTGFFDPANDLPGTIEYIVSGTLCPNDTAEVIVNVIAPPSAGTNGTVDFCELDSPIDLTTFLGTPDAGGTWSPILDGGGDIFDPSTDIAGTYTYTVTAAPCASNAADVIVSISSGLSAGRDSLFKTCDDKSNLNLITLLSADAEAGGTWLDDDATGALTGSVFTVGLVTAPGIYNFTYVQINTAPCENDSATVTVEILDCAGIDEISINVLKVFPNPATDLVTIDAGEYHLDKIEVLTISGELLISQTSLDINIVDLASGTYIVKAIAGNIVLTSLIIKN